MDIENVEITMRELNAINSAMNQLNHCHGRTLFEKLYDIGGELNFHIPDKLDYERRDEGYRVAQAWTLVGRIYAKTDYAGRKSIVVSLPKRKT